MEVIFESPQELLKYIREELETRTYEIILDAMNEEELEEFADILFEELVELVQQYEKWEIEVGNQIYG